MTGADPLPADPTDEVLAMPPGPSTDVLAERIESVRTVAAAHELADQVRHSEVMRELAEMRSDGQARGIEVGARVDAADARAHGRERWLIGLVAMLVLGVLGLAGVQVSGGGFGVSGVVGAAAAAP